MKVNEKNSRFFIKCTIAWINSSASLSANAQTSEKDSEKSISSAMENNSGCSIEDAYMRGNTVTVVGRASKKCKIIAAIYSEATKDMYTSGYADVTGGTEEAFL